MCTAYNIGKRKGNFPKRLKTGAREQLDSISAETLMRPTLKGPVILPDGGLTEMRWGFSRKFSNAVVNAREDKLDSQMWQDAMQASRCLIPVAAYYEWSGPSGRKRTHRFTCPDENWLWIAGIWERNDERGECFSMITTEPTGVVRGIHNRMPAVLSLDETENFLDGRMRRFVPASRLLQVEESGNPLQKGKPQQSELF